MPLGLVSMMRSVRCSASRRMYGMHISGSAMPRITAIALSRQEAYPQAPQLSWSSGFLARLREDLADLLLA